MSIVIGEKFQSDGNILQLEIRKLRVPYLSLHATERFL
jgi:hypothetical protein